MRLFSVGEILSADWYVRLALCTQLGMQDAGLELFQISAVN